MCSIIRLFVQQTECLNRFTDLKENVSFLANNGQTFIAYPTLVFKFLFQCQSRKEQNHIWKSHYFPPCLSPSPSVSRSLYLFPSLSEPSVMERKQNFTDIQSYDLIWLELFLDPSHSSQLILHLQTKEAQTDTSPVPIFSLFVGVGDNPIDQSPIDGFQHCFDRVPWIPAILLVASVCESLWWISEMHMEQHLLSTSNL